MRRTVLELGSGVGLTGVALCRSCRPSRYVFSDCHASVLQRLRDNVRLNGLTAGTRPPVSVEEIDWSEVTEERLKQIGADVVIAAGWRGTFDRFYPNKTRFESRQIHDMKQNLVIPSASFVRSHPKCCITAIQTLHPYDPHFSSPSPGGGALLSSVV